MTDRKDSKRQILRATSIIGGATLGTVLIGMARMKVIALLIGPAGVGLLGLFNTVMAMGFSIVGMAIETSGIRQISEAAGDPKKERLARWGLWTFAWPLALIAIVVFWFLQTPLTLFAIGEVQYSKWTAWIGLGVAASIIGAAQLAILQSHQRMGDLARIKLGSALAASVVGIAAIYLYQTNGIIAVVISAPLATVFLALFYRRKLPRIKLGPIPRPSMLSHQWKLLLTLGAVVTVSAAIGSGGQLLARSMLIKQLGLGEAGLFQASYAISSLNMTLLLGAMIPHFYPRLSAATDNNVSFERIVNDQVHMALVLGAPLLLAISVAAPLVLLVLYSSSFSEAALLLRLQVVGDAMRVLGWGLGLALLARKAVGPYFVVEGVFTAVFIPCLLFFLPFVGLEAAGVAYLIAYSLTLATSILLSARYAGVRVDRGNLLVLLVLVAVLAVTVALSLVSSGATIAFGCAGLAGFSIYALRELSRLGVQLNPQTHHEVPRRPSR